MHHRGRPPKYGMAVKQALVRVWAIMSFAAGKRLAPFMADLVQALERHGEIDLPLDVRALLIAMSVNGPQSPATMTPAQKPYLRCPLVSMSTAALERLLERFTKKYSMRSSIPSKKPCVHLRLAMVT